MDNADKEPTVERSLDALSEALGKASDDLAASRAAIDQARADMASHNTSISREVVKSSERVIEGLKDVDEALRHILKDLAERD
jgi:ABC-type transporter Mla subunit MlaD